MPTARSIRGHRWPALDKRDSILRIDSSTGRLESTSHLDLKGHSATEWPFVFFSLLRWKALRSCGPIQFASGGIAPGITLGNGVFLFSSNSG
jgi:hypothetical protein